METGNVENGSRCENYRRRELDSEINAPELTDSTREPIPGLVKCLGGGWGKRFPGPCSGRQTRWQGGNRAFLSNGGGHAHPPPKQSARRPHPHREQLAGKGSLSYYRNHWGSRALGSSFLTTPLRPARPSAAPSGGTIVS